MRLRCRVSDPFSWLLLSHGERDGARRGEAALVSGQKLSEFAASLDYPVYLGRSAARVAIRAHPHQRRPDLHSLPTARGRAGDPRANFLTVGTYPQENAFETLQQTAAAQGAETVELPRGGLAFQDVMRPTSVSLAYPRSDYQVEVYAPVEDTARTLVAGGGIRAIGSR